MFGVITRIVSPYEGNIPNTGRVERIIKLITYLNHYRTRKEIANHLGIGYKTVARYIHLLGKLGFEVERRFGKYNSFKILNTREVFQFE